VKRFWPSMLMAALLTPVAFYCYSLVRTMADQPLGFDLRLFLITMVFALVLMGLPAAFVVAIVAVLRTLLSRDLPQSRLERNLCPWCGYSQAGRGELCPECGRTPELPAKARVTAAVLGLALAVTAAALLAGSAAAEAWVLIDEAAFVQEAKAAGGPHYRPRRWPNTNSGLVYDPARGFWATD
jgi:hypothetical protein